VSYWDSSALVKLYVREADSSIFEQYAATVLTVPITSHLAVFEIQTTLWRKESEGTIIGGSAKRTHEKLLQDIADGNIRIADLSPEAEHEFGSVLERCFQQKPPVAIRTLDAIHLGSAISSKETEVVATDKRLRDAANFLGLKVFP